MKARLRLGSVILAISLVAAAARAFAGNPPRAVGEIFDGAPSDLAVGPGALWLAQGRNLAVLDPVTGERAGDDALSPYPASLVAVDYDEKDALRLVATREAVYLTAADGTVRTWSRPADGSVPPIVDVETLPGSEKVFVAAGSTLVVLDCAGTSIHLLSQVQSPPQASLGFKRLRVADVGGRTMAYVVATQPSASLPRRNGLLVADLDRAHGYASPVFLGSGWNPSRFYADDQASTRAVEVFPGLFPSRDVAFLADSAGGLSCLDVTDPAHLQFLQQVAFGPGGTAQAAFNLAWDQGRGWLHVAGLQFLHTLDPRTLVVLGGAPVEFVGAGEKDMALAVQPDGRRLLWTATHGSLNYVVHGIDVSQQVPVNVTDRWWLSSSDGGVAVPSWNSAYLPTFGGVVRYDVGDEAHPVAVRGSYRPANGVTEHIELMWPDPADRDHAVLLTAPGTGGAELWRISASNPNPGAPARIDHRPAHWAPTAVVYQNDVASYRHDGVNYVLVDLSNLTTGQVALQAWNATSGAWVVAVEQAPFLEALSNDVLVSGDHAFVACRGGFFVVRLDGLPAAMTVVQCVTIDADGNGILDRVGSIAADGDGTHLFVATDESGAVLSYAFSPGTHRVTGPLDTLRCADLTGCVGRLRHHAATDRLYVASRSARVVEVSASDPRSLRHLSTWQSPGYSGEMQDVQIYDFGHGPRVMAVKDTEGFAILDPDDGL